MRGKLQSIDHPSFDDPTAGDAILAPLTDSADDQASRRLQPSEWLTALPAVRSGPPFLSRDQEARLFRKMNYLNHRQMVVERWVCRLDERERRILVSRFGIGGAPKKTLVQIGQEMGISKERVRQIEARAIAELQEIAQREAL